MNRLKRLISEIHRRSLWQVLLIYIGAAWACFELIEAVTNRLGLPAWLPGLAIVLFLLALPVVLATAFVHEVPAPAVARPEAEAEEPAEALAARHEARRRHRFLTWRNAGVSFMAALAVWGVIATGWLVLHERGEPSTELEMLVVLPFENLGSPEDEYFADGITEEITSRLAELSGLGVIARTSAFQYKGTQKTVAEIGRELGVQYLLEGTVRWEKPREGESRVRVTPQLIKVADATHVWTERYDAVLAGIFQIQSDIAEQVAEALELTLLAHERRALERKVTDNLEAYDYYLRGNEYRDRFWSGGDLRAAVQLYEKAIELDPGFALAFAWLSISNGRVYWYYHDRSAERLAETKHTAEEALRLNPESPEAHVALGYYYYREYDLHGALEEYAIAQRIQPSNALASAATAYVLRRQGEWDKSVESLSRAMARDPRNHTLPHEQGITYRRLRRYVDAERYFDRAISLAPTNVYYHLSKALLYLLWTGDTGKARQVLEAAWDKTGTQLLYAGNDPCYWWLYRMIYTDYEQALNQFAKGSFGTDTASYLIAKAELYALGQDSVLARVHYDSARAILERKSRGRPEEARFHSELGVAYAGLGDKERAIHEGKRAVELLPVSRDPLAGADWVAYLAQIYVMVGDYDAALDELDYLLSIPSVVSVPLLRIDPTYDPLRDHPHFQALLAKYE